MAINNLSALDGLYKTLKTDYRDDGWELQQALAYNRDAERRQLEEIKSGQPSRLRRVRASQATADRPTSNGGEYAGPVARTFAPPGPPGGAFLRYWSHNHNEWCVAASVIAVLRMVNLPPDRAGP